MFVLGFGVGVCCFLCEDVSFWVLGFWFLVGIGGPVLSCFSMSWSLGRVLERFWEEFGTPIAEP